MLESLRLWPHIRARIEAGPLGPHLFPYVMLLRNEGYARSMVRRHVRAIDAFGAWLRRRRIPVEGIDAATVNCFACTLPRRRCSARPRGGSPEVVGWVRKFATFLWATGAARCGTATPPTEANLLLQMFDKHLDSVKGLAPGTRSRYLRYARLFLETKFGSATPDWSRVGVADIVDFARVQAAKLKPSACRAPVTAIRALLRYLALTGAVRSGLGGAIPAMREWKHASLPTYLSSEDVERVLADCGGETAVRRRDRAILLLLARLGLRASEVAELNLDDIDWRQGRVMIRAGKTGMTRELPLSGEVGEALVSYLREGRPNRCGGPVFLRSRPPYGRLSSAAVSSVAKRALLRSGVAAVHLGSHVFRHSAATRMVRRGATFKEVADVLGHASLTTTAIYAKLDLRTLGRVALPWPEVLDASR
jgi:integrase/recombinase XerD